MILGQYHVQTTPLGNAWTEQNVSPASCHVRRDGDSRCLPRECDNAGFHLVLFGVEQRMGDASLGQDGTYLLGRLDRACADQYRPMGGNTQAFDDLRHCTPFFRPRGA